MKNRILWLLILAVGGTAAFFGITRPHVSTLPNDLRQTIDDLKPAIPPLEPPPLVIPELPPPTIPLLQPMQPLTRADPVPSRPEVPVQDQATIDFSTGAPVVKRHGADQDALDSALKEISDVLKETKVEAKQN